MTVLLATHRRATEVDRLIDELRRRTVDFCRVNMGVLEDQCSVALSEDRAPSVLFATDGRVVRGEDITSGWYHQPPIAVVPESLASSRAGRDALHTSHTNAWLGALAQLDCPWVNSPWGVEQSANKIVQFIRAQGAGLKVPTTVVGNVPHEVRSRFAGVPTIGKNIASLHQAWATRSDLSFLTRTIEVNGLADDQIAACPIIYQTSVEPWREHRVVIVDGRSFAVSIDQGARDGYVDVRSTPSAVSRFYASHLDVSVLAGLRGLLDTFGLRYCSADFIETRDGQFYFLDLNSCGAWWWVDDLHDLQVTQALADAVG